MAQSSLETSTIVKQQEFRVFNVGENVPYKIFQASPLITCFAYVLNYKTHEGQDKMILYHAHGGKPQQEFNEIVSIIKSEADIGSVDVKIAVSDPINDLGVQDVLKQAKEIFRQNGFDVNTKFKVVEQDTPIYAADTRGNHGRFANKLIENAMLPIKKEFLEDLKTEISSTEWNKKGKDGWGNWAKLPDNIKKLRDDVAPLKDNNVSATYDHVKYDIDNIKENKKRHPDVINLYDSLKDDVKKIEAGQRPIESFKREIASVKNLNEEPSDTKHVTYSGPNKT